MRCLPKPNVNDNDWKKQETVDEQKKKNNCTIVRVIIKNKNERNIKKKINFEQNKNEVKDSS